MKRLVTENINSLVKKYKEKGTFGVFSAVWRYFLLRSYSSIMLDKVLSKKLKEKLIMAPRVGYWPRISTPRSFNEKIMYRKIYTSKEVYGKLADKVEVRKYVKNKVGEKILNEIYEVRYEVENLNFEILPNEFIIKTGNKGVIIVDDKKECDLDAVREKCKKKIKKNYGIDKGEYWYGWDDPKIVVENRLRDDKWDIPLDFKFFVFGGRVEYIEVDFNRFSNHERSMYRKDWKRAGFEYEYPKGPDIEKPDRLDEMISIAETLGKKFSFVRVDLYSPNDEKVVFGEMTFAPEGGGGRFYPKKYDYILGNMWQHNIA
jgi:hypothetical protein